MGRQLPIARALWLKSHPLPERTKRIDPADASVPSPFWRVIKADSVWRLGLSADLGASAKSSSLHAPVMLFLVTD